MNQKSFLNQVFFSLKDHALVRTQECAKFLLFDDKNPKIHFHSYFQYEEFSEDSKKMFSYWE